MSEASSDGDEMGTSQLLPKPAEGHFKAEMAVQEGGRQAANAETFDKRWCEWCGHAVDEEEYPWKFVAAGGYLAGPFCGKKCQLLWLSHDELDKPDARRVMRNA